MELELRLLDPQTDLELFKEAYSWRTRPKKHVQPDRMPFEVFSADDPSQITVGLFNGEFLAVFFFHEYEPGCFEAHFTSCRNIPRETLLEGAKAIQKCFLDNGARELTAWITERNRPLQAFLASLGFTEAERARYSVSLPQNSACANGTPTLDCQSDTRVFVKYAVKGEPP